MTRSTPEVSFVLHKFRPAKRGMVMLIAAFPLVCILLSDHTIRSEGWRPWSNGWYLGFFAAVIAFSMLWARHFLRGNSRFWLATVIVFCGVVWKIFATDWIVETPYDHMGTLEHRNYFPPVSPLWNPPQPRELAIHATSWRDVEFFYMGGAGGPTEEPRLRVHFELSFAKLTLVSMLAYMAVFSLLSRGRARAR